jgi:TetR/AcrR family transcriptional regulator
MGIIVPYKRRTRARGRPADVRESVGAEAIVLYVCELLRRLAPGQITLVRVAEHAGVDRSLIRYYFRKRSSLLLAAARHLFAQLQNELAAAKAIPFHDAERRLRESARALLRFQIKHPYFHRLMVDEVVNSGEPEARDFFRSFTGTALAEYRETARAAGREPGAREVDGAFLYMATIGMCEFFVTGMPILRIAFGKDYDDEVLNRQFEAFICDYVVDGIRRR